MTRSEMHKAEAKCEESRRAIERETSLLDKVVKDLKNLLAKEHGDKLAHV